MIKMLTLLLLLFVLIGLGIGVLATGMYFIGQYNACTNLVTVEAMLTGSTCNAQQLMLGYALVTLSILAFVAIIAVGLLAIARNIRKVV